MSGKDRRKVPDRRTRPRFSKATMKVTKKKLKEEEKIVEEAFLVRADINRRLQNL